MTRYPWDLVREVMRLPGVPRIQRCAEAHNLVIDRLTFPIDTYEELRRKIVTHFERELLSPILYKELAFDTTVLVHSVDQPQDYLRDLLVSGLLQNNNRVFVTFDVDFLFEDSRADTRRMWGRGFTYTRSVDPALRGKLRRIELDQFATLPKVDVYVLCTKSNLPPPVADCRVAYGRLVLVDGNDPGWCERYPLDARIENAYLREPAPWL